MDLNRNLDLNVLDSFQVYGRNLIIKSSFIKLRIRLRVTLIKVGILQAHVKFRGLQDCKQIVDFSATCKILC